MSVAYDNAHDGYDDELLNEADDDIVASRPRATKATPSPRGGAGLPWVLVAVLIGVILGMIWMIDRQDSGDAAADPTASASQTVTEQDLEVERAKLEAVVAEEPDNADAHASLGVILFNLGEDELARQHYETAISLNPDQLRAWYGLGFYYLYQSEPDFTKAQAAWQRVLEIAPDSEEGRMVADHLSALSGPSATASPSDAETGG